MIKRRAKGWERPFHFPHPGHVDVLALFCLAHPLGNQGEKFVSLLFLRKSGNDEENDGEAGRSEACLLFQEGANQLEMFREAAYVM